MVAAGAGTAAAAVVAVGVGTAATTVVATRAGTVVAAVAAELELLAGGGEDFRTLGRKLCPLRVFTVAGLEKEKRWRGWEEERFQK